MPTSSEMTLPLLFEESVRKYPDNIYLWEKVEGKYRGTTYKQVRDLIYRCASGFLSLGLQKGDRVGLISEGRTEWVVSELGVLYAGGVNVPLSVKIDELSELKFRLFHAGCRMVIVSETQWAKVAALRDELRGLEKVILLDGGEGLTEREISFTGLLERGEAFLEDRREEFERAWQGLRGCDLANICYTSGTVADPKGIVLSHRNYTANVEQSVALYPLPEWFCTLLVLPWDHAFAHTAGIYALASTGSSAAAVQRGRTPMETLRNIPINMKEIRPTFLMSVPALAKNLRKGIVSGVREKGAMALKLFEVALRIAYAYNREGWNRGTGWRVLLRPLTRVFDIILFKKIRESFGGRLEYFIGGGALLDIELQRFFYALGMPMYQGYGLTEASPVISANTPAKHKLGSSGVIVPDLEVRICDESGKDVPPGQPGEIVIRGANVMWGYWKNEKATRETLRDGWLFTGDLGYLEADGFLTVLGREKSLLIGFDGEKYSPEGIEETIAGNSLYIDQIMLHNNQSQYTVALMVPNRDALLSWLKRHHLAVDAPEGQRRLLKLLDAEVAAYRPGGRHAGMFPERWLPSAVALLDEGFTEQNRLLNSTLKMVRGRIVEKYRDRLEFLYSPRGKDIISEQNLSVVRAWSKVSEPGKSA
jgi:long-chain acyl-CoA synthetase